MCKEEGDPSKRKGETKMTAIEARAMATAYVEETERLYKERLDNHMNEVVFPQIEEVAKKGRILITIKNESEFPHFKIAEELKANGFRCDINKDYITIEW